MRKIVFAYLLSFTLLAGCAAYQTSDGGYAFDVQIRIAAPRAIPTLIPPITPLPTATRTLTPTRANSATVQPTVTLTRTPTTVAVTTTPFPTWTPEDPTPTLETTVIFNTPEPPQEGVVITNILNVRRCASQTCLVAYKINQGTMVYITEEVEVDEVFRVWYEIDVPGTIIEGWAAAAYIERDHG